MIEARETPSKGELRGMLARGRGAGFLLALDVGRSAATDVFWCIETDPRVDRTSEERALYFANVILALNLDPSSVASLCSDLFRPTLTLAEQVLSKLAARGEAISVARWRELGGEEYERRLEAQDRESRSALVLQDERDSKRIAQAARASELELIEAFELGGAVDRLFAASELGRRDSPALLPYVTDRLSSDIDLSNEEHAVVFGYWKALSKQRTLDLSRQWITSPGTAGMAALITLARHAEAADLQALLARGHESLQASRSGQSSEVQALIHVAKALARSDHPSATPFLLDAFQTCPNSLGRYALAEALGARKEQPGVRALLDECAWDCEDRTRELGMRLANPSDPRMRERASALAIDDLESNEVRFAARALVRRRSS